MPRRDMGATLLQRSSSSYGPGPGALPSPLLLDQRSAMHPHPHSGAEEHQQLLLEPLQQQLLERSSLLEACGMLPSASLGAQESQVMSAIDKALGPLLSLQIPALDVCMHEELVVADMTPGIRALADSLSGTGAAAGAAAAAATASARGDDLHGVMTVKSELLDGLIARGPITSPALSSLLASPRMQG
jgi:hypothetical protein